MPSTLVQLLEALNWRALDRAWRAVTTAICLLKTMLSARSMFWAFISLGSGNKNAGWQVGNRFFHQEICVDLWAPSLEPDEHCCKVGGGWFKKTGERYCISFAFDAGRLGGEPVTFRSVGFDWLGEATTIPVLPGWTLGIVYDTGDQEIRDSGVIDTTCEEDLEFMMYLMSSVGKRDKYEVDAHNCRTFAQREFRKAHARYGGD